MGKDVLQIGGYVAPPSLEGCGLVTQDRRHRVEARFAGKGLLTGEHLVQHHPEGKDVRPRIDRVTLHLLGRHVGQRSENLAGPRDLRRSEGSESGHLGRHRRCFRFIVTDQLAQAEV